MVWSLSLSESRRGYSSIIRNWCGRRIIHVYIMYQSPHVYWYFICRPKEELHVSPIFPPRPKCCYLARPRTQNRKLALGSKQALSILVSFGCYCFFCWPCRISASCCRFSSHACCLLPEFIPPGSDSGDPRSAVRGPRRDHPRAHRIGQDSGLPPPAHRRHRPEQRCRPGVFATPRLFVRVRQGCKEKKKKKKNKRETEAHSPPCLEWKQTRGLFFFVRNPLKLFYQAFFPTRF